VGVRTNHENEPVYLYRLNTSATMRAGCPGLPGADQRTRRSPEFYHLRQQLHHQHRALRDAAGGWRVELRHLLTVWSMATSMTQARIDTTVAFDELRRRSLINRRRGGRCAPDFLTEIRASVPTMPHLGHRTLRPTQENISQWGKSPADT